MRRACRSCLFAACGIVALGVAYAQAVQPTSLQVETVASGLTGPTAMAFLGPSDILVTQKSNGRVRRVISGVLQSTAVLDVAVNASGERGLLGMALDPDFVNNGNVYVHYTEAATVDGGTALGNRLYRYFWDGSALVAPALVLDLPPDPGPDHTAGVILFGSDDYLYAVIGDLERDGQLQNDPNGAAPDDTSVIVRIDRGGRGVIDNPFYDAANRQNPLNRYYAYGVRNSFGLAFDPVSGDLWDTENGESNMDEVNRVFPGFNSGWREIMGPDSRSSGSTSNLWNAPGSSYADPQFTWAVPVAPTALTFVASRRMGCALEHRLLVGNFQCGSLQRFELDGTRSALTFAATELQDRVADNSFDRCATEQAELAFGSGFGIVTDIENGSDGFVYVLSYNQGVIYRIRPVATIAGDLDGDLVPAACDCDDTSAGAWADPTELRQLRVSRGSEVRLGWDPQGGIAGTGTTYSVVSGSLEQLRSSAGFAEACLSGTGLAMPSTTDARPGPPAGDAYYYLVRAENACAAGTYGDASGIPDPRDVLDASSPPLCN